METLKKERCPSCGELEGLPLVWGDPDEETQQAVTRGEIILAGRVIWRDFLDFECRKCGHQWQDPETQKVSGSEPR